MGSRLHQELLSLKGVATPITEQEPNNTSPTAQFLPLGFDSGEFDSIVVNANASYTVSQQVLGSEVENNGSIPLATALPLTAGVPGLVEITNHMIDSNLVPTNGKPDVDAFSFTAGPDQLVTVEFVQGSLEKHDLVVYDSTATQVVNTSADFVELDAGPGGDTFTLFVMAKGVAVSHPNIWDTASGSGGTGTYGLRVGFDALEEDWFSFELEPGDMVIGSGGEVHNGVVPHPLLRFFRPGGELVIESDRTNSLDLSDGGSVNTLDASFVHIAEESGVHKVSVTNWAGTYPLQLFLFRPPIESEPAGTTQTLFIDFDGAAFDLRETFGVSSFSSGVSSLSPLSAFLGDWGLQPSDEDAVIDAILATVEEKLLDDLRALGLNGDRSVSGIDGEFDLLILNSRDHADPWGQPNVSRVVVGGTNAEAGNLSWSIFFGLVESFDPGNFNREETAVLFLDILSSDPAPCSGCSLNDYLLAPGASKVDLVGRGVGIAVSNHASRLFGCRHTNSANGTVSITDGSGISPDVLGIGSDGLFGSADDTDVDIATDESPVFLLGIQNSANVLSWGLATGTVPPTRIEDWGLFE